MKKNFRKILSLTLALCMVFSFSVFASAASNEATASGGTATSSVNLSSTDDGTLNGDPAATKMSVTVPTVLPIAVGTDGTVTVATDAVITNNSYGAVKVDTVSIEAGSGWSLTAFGDKSTLAAEKVDSNKLGFAITLGGGAQQITDTSDDAAQTLIDSALTGCYMTGVGDTTGNTIAVNYNAIVTPVSEAVTNSSIASVLFIICWDTAEELPS